MGPLIFLCRTVYMSGEITNLDTKKVIHVEKFNGVKF